MTADDAGAGPKPRNRCAACGQFTRSENGHAVYDVIDGTWEFSC